MNKVSEISFLFYAIIATAAVVVDVDKYYFSNFFPLTIYFNACVIYFQHLLAKSFKENIQY